MDNNTFRISPDTMTATVRVSQQPEKMHCPRCHRDTDQHIAVFLGGEVDGQYCLWCYAEWIKANLPRMEPLP